MHLDRSPEGIYSSLAPAQVVNNHLDMYLWKFIPQKHVSVPFSFYIIYAGTDYKFLEDSGCLPFPVPRKPLVVGYTEFHKLTNRKKNCFIVIVANLVE